MDDLPLFRPTDPYTSREAAEQTVERRSRSQRIVMAVVERSALPRTAQEIAQRCATEFGGQSETYRKRFHELVRDGSLVECPPRICDVTGSRAMTYREAERC